MLSEKCLAESAHVGDQLDSLEATFVMGVSYTVPW